MNVGSVRLTWITRSLPLRTMNINTTFLSFHCPQRPCSDPGINMHPEWSYHKQTALKTGVNTPMRHWGRIEIWSFRPHSNYFGSVYANISHWRTAYSTEAFCINKQRPTNSSLALPYSLWSPLTLRGQGGTPVRPAWVGCGCPWITRLCADRVMRA